MIGLFAIFVFLGLDLAYAITVLKLNNTCNGSNTNMGCFKLPGDLGYEITCPKHNLSEKIFVQFKHFSKSLLVDIKCENLDPINYCLLSNVETKPSQIIKIHFENCPLATDTVLMDIIQTLGFKNITVLEVNDIELKGMLRKQQLSGLGDLKSIFMHATSQSEIPEDFFENMHLLESLVLRNTQLFAFTAFMHLTNLVNLDVSNSVIKDLSKASFKGLNKLEYLHLRNNSIKELHMEIFEDASSLNRLDISSNELEELDANVFTALKHLADINFSYNNFLQLPEQLFKHNLNLKQILLTDNRRSMPMLPKKLFANLPILENVTVGCDLQEVPVDLFANSSDLQTITISNNSLTTLPEFLFRDQYNLLQLDLTNNELQYIPDGLFDSLKSLIVLQLTDNKINKISE